MKTIKKLCSIFVPSNKMQPDQMEGWTHSTPGVIALKSIRHTSRFLSQHPFSSTDFCQLATFDKPPSTGLFENLILPTANQFKRQPLPVTEPSVLNLILISLDIPSTFLFLLPHFLSKSSSVFPS